MIPFRAVVVAFLLSATALYAQNPIVTENARPGTDRWQLGNTARNDEIEGYASHASVNVGENISFYVSSADPAYTIEIFRMGWYGGLGGRRMTNPVERSGIRQTIPAPDSATGIVECDWRDPFVLTIPGDWVSGVYLAKLTAIPSGEQNHIIFTVRDDARTSALLFQNSVTTWQAYNAWGGRSLYAFNSTGAQATKVSFNRPYTLTSGPSEFLFRWEYPMVRWLEREGFDVTYTTNIETHARPQTLLNHRAFLSVGHDEYWTWEMRENVQHARDSGVDLGFFSANTSYWQIRLEPDRFGKAHRTIVGYKETALSSDPIVADGNPGNDHLVTTKWRDVPVIRPEEQLIGVMYTAHPVDADIVIANASHWVFAGTGLANGSRLQGLLGYEVDRMHGFGPPGLVLLAESPFVTTDDFESGVSHMTIYRAASGAWVFATGSIQWSWGLDDFNSSSRGSRLSPAAQQITRNILERFVNGDPPARRRVVRK